MASRSQIRRAGPGKIGRGPQALWPKASDNWRLYAGDAVAAAPVETDLIPGVLLFEAVALNPVPGVVTVNLTPAVLVFNAVALDPDPGPVTTTLTPAVLVFSAVALDPDPGPVTTSLTPAVLVFSAVALDPQPSPSTVNLTPAVLVFSAVSVDPDPGAVTTSLTPAVLTFQAVALDADPGAVTTNLTPAVLNFSAVALDPDPGAVTVNLTPAVLVFDAVALDPEPTPTTVDLAPAALNFSAVALDPVPGAATIDLTPAVLAFSAVALTPVSGMAISPATLTFQAVALDPVPGHISLTLTPATLLFTAVPLDPLEGMVISMTVYGPPPLPALPCSWDVNVTCCATYWETLTDDEQQSAAEYGALIAWAATGRRFGLCERTVRPCGQATDNPNGYFWTDGTWMPYTFRGQWRNCAGCNAGYGCCSCEPRCQVWLPGPIYSIPATGISVDGDIVDVDAWRVDDNKWLVRTDGECWPTCQDFNVDSGTGYFSVTYLGGMPVPRVLLGAAGELACEWARACRGDPCRLPQRITSISRQGLSVSLADIDGLLDRGLTGITTVDQVIRSFNPSSIPSRMNISSPDWPPVTKVTTYP